ncbi:MAG: nitrogen regulation protein NR(I) [Sphingomonadaceae bacterium]|nr:nitrogen regulation protein NR(I) [Sphingomonadaceae bacterium]
MSSVLLADDDDAIRTVVREKLRREGHRVETVGSIAEMRRALDQAMPDVLVTDVVFPDGNGLEFLAELFDRDPLVPVIVLSAQNTLTTAVQATERGAFEYLPKPFDLDELARAVADACAKRGARPAEFEAPSGEELPLIGRSAAMQEVYRVIARVVANDLTVLILGESGTGKELVARAIHDLGRRREMPFVAINMAAIPRELIESELFGHERGAFTGAAARTAGKFEQAQGGTLFLDEIGDMPMEAQTRLLRVLQQGEFTTVGGARAIKADLRIVAATHKDLGALIEANQFREDLFYRLNVVPIRLPALRERPEDIGELARHFLERAAQEGLARKRLAPDAIARLAVQPWPGNVRELENVMMRVAALAREDVITAKVLGAPLAGGGGDAMASSDAELGGLFERWLAGYLAGGGAPDEGLYERVLAEIEPVLLRMAMAAGGGNQIRAAKLLGINRNTLRKKLTEREVEPRP